VHAIDGIASYKVSRQMRDVRAYLGMSWIEVIGALVRDRPAWVIREDGVGSSLGGRERIGDEPSMEAQTTCVASLDSEAHGIVVSEETFASEARGEGLIVGGVDDRTTVAELEEDRVVAIGLQTVEDTQKRLLLAAHAVGRIRLITGPVETVDGSEPYGTHLLTDGVACGASPVCGSFFYGSWRGNGYLLYGLLYDLGLTRTATCEAEGKHSTAEEQEFLC